MIERDREVKSDTLSHGQITAGAVAVQVVPAARAGARSSVLIQNMSSNRVYLGGPTVSASNTTALLPWDAQEFNTLAAIYAVADAEGSTVGYQVEA